MPRSEQVILQTSWTKDRGGILALDLFRRLKQAEDTTKCTNMPDNFYEAANHIFDEYITYEFCQCVCCNRFSRMLVQRLEEKATIFYQTIQTKYMEILGFKTQKELQKFEEKQLAEIKEINSKVPGLHTPTE